MSESIDLINRIISAGSEAAVVIENGVITGLNSAAYTLFSGKLKKGKRAESFFPLELLECAGESFACSVNLLGVEADISAVRSGDNLTMFITPVNQGNSVLPGLSANVMNEINSSMSTLRLAADRLAGCADFRLEPKLRAYTCAFYHSYYKLLRLTENITSLGSMLDGTYPIAAKLEDMRLLCEEALSAVSSVLPENSANIRFDVPDGDYTINIDRDLTERMLLNLLANSLENTAAGDEIIISLRREDNAVVLGVDDTGHGIAGEDYSSLLRRFEHKPDISDLAKLSGAGMGLSIVSGIARLHGGTMVIESRKDRGTSVRVTIPDRDDLPTMFKSTMPRYRDTGMSMVLTELSTVLDSSVYASKFFD